MSAPRRWPRGGALVEALLVGLLLAIAALIATARVLGAQDAVSGADPRLAERLDPATASALTSLVDSARTAGLPSEPLVRRALQGAIKRADGARIVAAVRSLARELAAARNALGAASEAELVAGASALHAGVTSTTLRALRRSRPDQPLTIPLAVLADLVSAGVPADTAARAVLALAERGVRDAEFSELRTDVERDVQRGAPAGASAVLRAIGPAGAPVPRPPVTPPASTPRPDGVAPVVTQPPVAPVGNLP